MFEWVCFQLFFGLPYKHYGLPNIANSTCNPIATFLSQIIKKFACSLLPQNRHCFFIIAVKSAKLYYIIAPRIFFYNANYIMTSSINKNFQFFLFLCGSDVYWLHCPLISACHAHSFLIIIHPCYIIF